MRALTFITEVWLIFKSLKLVRQWHLPGSVRGTSPFVTSFNLYTMPDIDAVIIGILLDNNRIERSLFDGQGRLLLSSSHQVYYAFKNKIGNSKGKDFLLGVYPSSIEREAVPNRLPLSLASANTGLCVTLIIRERTSQVRCGIYVALSSPFQFKSGNQQNERPGVIQVWPHILLLFCLLWRWIIIIASRLLLNPMCDGLIYLRREHGTVWANNSWKQKN